MDEPLETIFSIVFETKSLVKQQFALTRPVGVAILRPDANDFRAGQGSLGKRGGLVNHPKEGMLLHLERSVLIVDRSEETREVLKTALQRRGLRIFEASRARRGIELAETHQPDLIVLDLEVGSAPPEETAAPFTRQSDAHHTPLVMLGSARIPQSEGKEIMAKPYHFGPLVRKIEELLDASGPVAARSA